MACEAAPAHEAPFFRLPATVCISPITAVNNAMLVPSQMNEISKRKEYGGRVRERVQALSECCYGGQIIIDAATFEGVSACMSNLVAKVPAAPDFSAIADYVR